MRVGVRGFAIQVSSDQNGSGRATAGPLLLRFGTALETPISRLCARAQARARAGWRNIAVWFLLSGGSTPMFTTFFFFFVLFFFCIIVLEIDLAPDVRVSGTPSLRRVSVWLQLRSNQFSFLSRSQDFTRRRFR